MYGQRECSGSPSICEFTVSSFLVRDKTPFCSRKDLLGNLHSSFDAICQKKVDLFNFCGFVKKIFTTLRVYVKYIFVHIRSCSTN